MSETQRKPTGRSSSDGSLPVEASLEISRGQIMQAIRVIRVHEGVDLAGAKARVDLYLEQNPLLQKRIQEQRKATRRQVIKWVLIVDALLIAAAVYWWFGR